MAYDTRPKSQGGNRGIDEEISRVAPKGKFRVIGIDTFDATDWLVGDFSTFKAAQKCADDKVKGKEMLKMHVYNDAGEHRHESGKF